MCILCEKVENAEDFLIHEFEHSLLIVGEHQYFKGYCQLVLKEHVADLTDLTDKVQESFFKELMISAKAIRKVYKPERMNYSSLGNVVPHIHFHLFPRYQEELNTKIKLDPWADAELFDNFKTTEEQISTIRELVRKEL